MLIIAWQAALGRKSNNQSHGATFLKLNGGPLASKDNGPYPPAHMHAPVSSEKRSVFLSRLLAGVLAVGAIGVSTRSQVLRLGRRRELPPCADDLLGIPSTLIIEINL
jgi:hypothetical protein